MRTGFAGLVIAAIAPAVASAQAPPPQRAFLDRYCVTCHSQRAKTAGLNSARLLTVDNLDPAKAPEHADTWETIVRKLRSGMMPPSGAPRPDAAALEIFLV